MQIFANANDVHWALDLETYGMVAGVHDISSIGIVQFNPYGTTSTIIFHMRLNYDRAVRADTRTLAWREVKVEENHLHGAFANYLVSDLCQIAGKEGIGPKTLHVWCWHAEFDIPFLNALCHEFDKDKSLPWHYRNVHDIPSFMAGVDVSRQQVEEMVDQNRRKKAGRFHSPFNKHNALEDARFNAACVQAVLQLRDIHYPHVIPPNYD